MKYLPRALFIVLCVIDVMMAVTTPMLPGGTEHEYLTWLACGVLVVCGFATRMVLGRRKDPAATAWADALKPTRFGAAIVLGVLALYLFALVLVLVKR